jgi:hypothetical protein
VDEQDHEAPALGEATSPSQSSVEQPTR